MRYLPGGDKPSLVCEHDQLRPITGPELDHSTADMCLCGRRTDDKPPGDFVIAEAVRDECHDFALAGGQLV